MFNFSIRCWRCFSTVLILMFSVPAICLLACPSATSCRTSVSREVRCAIFFLRSSSHIGTEEHAAAMHFADHLRNGVEGVLFDQIADGAQGGGLFDISVVLVGGEQ